MRISHNADLQKNRTMYKKRVDELAEKERGNYITLGSGQSMMYEQKLKESEAYLADQEIPLYEVPHIYNESQVIGDTVFNVAATVVYMAEQWKQISSLIEGNRLRLKQELDEATSDLEMQNIINSINFYLT